MSSTWKIQLDRKGRKEEEKQGKKREEERVEWNLGREEGREGGRKGVTRRSALWNKSRSKQGLSRHCILHFMSLLWVGLKDTAKEKATDIYSLHTQPDICVRFYVLQAK